MDFKKIIAEISRIILGATFLFSGTVKAIDPVGGAIKMEDYFGAFGLSFFNPLSLFVSINLSAVEFLLGLCIIMAVYRKLTTICMVAFMAFMTLLTLYLAIFNPVHDCGCFGEAIIITNWQTFFKNIFVLFPASVITYIYHKKMTPVYTYKAYWFVLLFGYIFSAGFSYYNYRNLPIIDFRPFKIGTNITQAMSIPEDAPSDEYLFVYEKDGKRDEFTPENAPLSDDSWKFVERKLIKQGYIPPITSFELFDKDENNIADIILDDEKGVVLLISPHLEKADDGKIDEINHIYDYSIENNIKFFCLTSSTADNINAWINDTGAEYPFLTADDVTLKTIIRSNPGIVLLKSGTILTKWHYNDLPSEETANTVINELLNSSGQKSDKEISPWVLIIFCFTLPLLLVWIYDYFRNRRKGNVLSI